MTREAARLNTPGVHQREEHDADRLRRCVPVRGGAQQVPVRLCGSAQQDAQKEQQQQPRERSICLFYKPLATCTLPVTGLIKYKIERHF